MGWEQTVSQRQYRENFGTANEERFSHTWGPSNLCPCWVMVTQQMHDRFWSGAQARLMFDHTRPGDDLFVHRLWMVFGVVYRDRPMPANTTELWADDKVAFSRSEALWYETVARTAVSESPHSINFLRHHAGVMAAYNAVVSSQVAPLFWRAQIPVDYVPVYVDAAGDLSLAVLAVKAGLSLAEIQTLGPAGLVGLDEALRVMVGLST